MQVEGKVESKVLIFGVQTQFSKCRQLHRVMLPRAFLLSRLCVLQNTVVRSSGSVK